MRTNSDLKLERLFALAMMMTVALAGAVLASAEGAFFPSGITPFVAVLTWLIVERNRSASVSPILANILGAVAFMVAANEFRSRDIEAKLLSGAHLIVYLTWVVLAMEKSVRQIWWLLALSVLQIAVASVLTSSPLFGGSLIVVMGVMIWTLAVFSLYRAYVRFRGTAEPSTPPAGHVSRRGMNRIVVRNGLQLDPTQPWVNRQIRGIVVVSFLGSLAMSLIVFALFPRIWVPGSPFADLGEDNERRIRGRTGFTETVTLGDIGQVLQSDNRALQFEIRDVRLGKMVALEQFINDMDMDEIRFRGNALGLYRNAKWRHGFRDKRFDTFGRTVDYPTRYEIKVVQDPPIGEFVFAVNPLTRAKSAVKDDRILRWTVSSVLSWENFHARRESNPDVQRAYTIECPSLRETPDATFEDWRTPLKPSPQDVTNLNQNARGSAERYFLSRDIEKDLPSLYRIATDLCRSANGRVDDAECVQRILDYLSLSNGFQYSLTIPFNNEALDPIEDFLLNTRSGSCEYFASAGALMLQANGIPARIVNGYVGCELNSVSGRYEVRQKHAHSWVEAFYENRWRTLDPTPSSSRRELVEASRSMMFFRQLKLAMSDIWTGGIQNLSWEQQKALIGPFLTAVRLAWEDIRQRGLWTSLGEFFVSLFTTPEKWFSWQGGLFTFVILLLGALLWRLKLFSRLAAVLRGLKGTLGVRQRTTRSVIRFYERFRDLCEAQGLIFNESSTAIETADAALQYFSDQLDSAQVRAAPELIAGAFNDVRFGRMELSSSRAAAVRSALDEFSQAIAASDGKIPVTQLTPSTSAT